MGSRAAQDFESQDFEFRISGFLGCEVELKHDSCRHRGKQVLSALG